jgi:hypothetical protein
VVSNTIQNWMCLIYLTTQPQQFGTAMNLKRVSSITNIAKLEAATIWLQ